MSALSKLNWVSPKITVAVSAHCGRGQVAKEDIQKDELLVVFGGHVMTMEDFYALPPEIRDFPYQISEEPDLVFGPASFEEVQHGEFFNHSCDPNTGFKDVLHLVAIRDIRAGEMITFDYAMCMTGDFGNMQCNCGATGCRERITGDDWKIVTIQQKYRGYF